MMTTKLHIALYAMALANKMGDTREYYHRLMDEVPYLVLPDAVRAYVGARQPSHFECLPDGTDNAWMIFPTEQTLKGLTEETAAECLQFQMESNLPKCVIGENTCLEAFDRLNWYHPHFHALRIHMLQDMVLDKAVRERMYDVRRRFKDEFHPRYNPSITMSGKEVREEIGTFERLAFLVVAGKCYESCGIVLNKEWFDRYVFTGLTMAYSDDLAAKTFSFMPISNDVNTRINQKNFELTDEEKESLGSPEMLTIMNEVLADGYLATFHEM